MVFTGQSDMAETGLSSAHHSISTPFNVASHDPYNNTVRIINIKPDAPKGEDKKRRTKDNTQAYYTNMKNALKTGDAKSWNKNRAALEKLYPNKTLVFAVPDGLTIRKQDLRGMNMSGMILPNLMFLNCIIDSNDMDGAVMGHDPKVPGSTEKHRTSLVKKSPRKMTAVMEYSPIAPS